MTEVVAATQDYVFFHLGKLRLIVSTRGDNTGSVGVKEKTGGLRVGTALGSYHDGEKHQDIWEITRDRWIIAREALGMPDRAANT